LIAAATAALSWLSAAESTAAALRFTFLHACLETFALFRRHARHSFFHPLAPLFGRHVRIESTASTTEAATAATFAGVGLLTSVRAIATATRFG
jgi:hypothetical protein